jgi:dUTP pyrophosphatase
VEELTFERLLHNDLDLPAYQTEGAAGFDFRACLYRTIYRVRGIKKEPFVYDIKENHYRKFDNIDENIIDKDIKPSVLILPDETLLLPTGFKVSFCKWRVLKLFIRSSLSIQGLVLANSVGIIDSDYRGEVMMAIKNVSNVTHTINHGDRVVQSILEELIRPKLVEGTTEQTDRGQGGFGSTGRG